MIELAPTNSVPIFIAENPAILTDAFGSDLLLNIGQISAMAIEHTRRVMPLYVEETFNPVVAGETGGGSCLARTGNICGLTSAFEHIQSAVAIFRGHIFDALAEQQGNHAVAIDTALSQNHRHPLTNELLAEDLDIDQEVGTFTVTDSVITSDAPQLDKSYMNTVLLAVRQNRSQTAGVVDLWHSQTLDSKTGRTILTTLPAQPDIDAIPTDVTGVRHTTVLLGLSATSFVNTLTGHVPMAEINRDPVLAHARDVFTGTTRQPYDLVIKLRNHQP